MYLHFSFFDIRLGRSRSRNRRSHSRDSRNGKSRSITPVRSNRRRRSDDSRGDSKSPKRSISRSKSRSIGRRSRHDDKSDD